MIEYLLYKKKTLQDAIATFHDDAFVEEMKKALEETEKQLQKKDTR